MGTLATHEEDGTNIVGGSSSRYEEDSWRDNDYGDEIETSKDSAPTRRLASPALSNIGTWVHTSRESKEMIVGYGSQKSDQYGAASVDLETMRATIRYLGHEGHITCIRTNEADPSTFMTAAMDGVVRLYDVRAPTPALAIHHADEFINAALDEHVGGQPFVIIGGTSTEQVEVWDVRAKLPLYELSTGNNQVRTLAWDGSTQTLYAGTECESVDRMGGHHDYRRIRKPRPNNRAQILV